MIPAARIAAVIDVLEAAKREKVASDRILSEFYRRRRYAGAKDRASINARVYGAVRRRIRLDWWLARYDTEATPRSRVLADLALSDARSIEEASALFDGSEHGPAALSETEQKLYGQLLGNPLEHPDAPVWVRCECPEWIANKLAPALGDQFESCLEALTCEASFDLRINPIITSDRESVRAALAKGELETEPTAYSPFGLRALARRRINGMKPFKHGVIEVQDEGAQLASLLVAAKPGMQVADFCAGAGGKTLLVGATMANKGRVLAMDVGADRLERAAPRIARAGLHNVERRVLKSEDDRFLKRWAKRFDRVLVDAPCTGVGTWRRTPEARMRYTESDLIDMIGLQDRILSSAARLTKPGGRLIYVTCSLLPEENEDRVNALLTRRGDYRVLPVAEVWLETVQALGGSECPKSGNFLRLTPDQHGTDGFFVAILERQESE
ncbi:MAG: RsmB/NOP family class I SAM-dependent RNA methyltransferase [Alphaproteobacteria bacterium]|nr:RsmB/NOP family class I SAM-dependent RNA methyltransferase [Alphaproteobacteria bacterium]